MRRGLRRDQQRFFEIIMAVPKDGEKNGRRLHLSSSPGDKGRQLKRDIAGARRGAEAFHQVCCELAEGS